MIIEFFRRNRRGVVGLFIVAMCGVLMLPFGLDYFQKQGSQVVVATIGDDTIKSKEYYLELDRVRSMLKRQFGAQYEQFENMINIKQKVLDDLIDRSLLKSFYSSLGFNASISQIESFTRALPVFQGGVSKEIFRSFLRSQGMTEAMYEDVVKDKLYQDQLDALFSSITFDSKDNIDLKYKKVETKLGIFSAKMDLKGKEIKIASEKVEEHFNKNRANFRTNKKIVPVIVRFLPERYKSSVRVEEEEIKEAYKLNKVKFEIPRRVSYQIATATHQPNALQEIIEGDQDKAKDEEKSKILLEEIREASLGKAESFLKMAKERGASILDEKELVEFNTLDQEVKDALRDLEEGSLSVVFKKGDGFAVVRLVKNVPASLRAFEEVRDSLLEEIVNSLSPEYAKVAADSFLAKVESSNSSERVSFLKNLAHEKGLLVEESSSPVEFILGLSPSDMKDIFTLSKGSSAIYTSTQNAGRIFVFIKEIEESREKNLEEVRSEIESLLRREEEIKASTERAGLMLASLSGGGKSLERGQNLKANLLKEKVKVEEHELAKRDAVILSMIDDPKEKDLILSEVESKGFYTRPFVSSKGEVYLFGLNKVEEPKTEISIEERQAFISRETKDNNARLMNQLIAYLRSKTKPEVSPEFSF